MLRSSAQPSYTSPAHKKIDRQQIVEALVAERQLVARGVAYRIKSADWDAAILRIHLEAAHGKRSGAIDDSLEESSCAWGADAEAFDGKGYVSFVDAEQGAVVLERWQGSRPEAGQTIRFFQFDFLRPLIDLWQSPLGLRTARELLHREAGAPLDAVDALPAGFSGLRKKQAEAVNSALFSLALIDGPPGTGKTFTLGALISNFLVRFPDRKVLVVGPTNTAVDATLCSADDWLKRLGRTDVASNMKRLGSRFDVKHYTDRQHLLEPGLYESAVAVLQMELDQPNKKEYAKYAVWKAKLRELRKALKNDLEQAVAASRVVAMTTASAVRYFGIIAGSNWDLVVADEASQIPFPTALAIGGLGPRCVFAGDPKQLAPVVQEKAAQRVLEKTAFDIFKKKAHSVFLNEQSRMCRDICDGVSKTFYEEKLELCARARSNVSWRKEREPFFVQSKKLPHLVLKELEADASWSKTYNGPIRFGSAKFVSEMVDEILGSYTNEDDIVVLTPYRAQRALISEFFRNRRVKVNVSTVHRAQGSERKIVIFDPVSANDKFINSESGTRLLNVAFSRAQVHLIIAVNSTDYHNAKLRQVREIAKRQQANLTRFDLPLIIQ